MILKFNIEYLAENDSATYNKRLGKNFQSLSQGNSYEKIMEIVKNHNVNFEIKIKLETGLIVEFKNLSLNAII